VFVVTIFLLLYQHFTNCSVVLRTVIFCHSLLMH